MASVGEMLSKSGMSIPSFNFASISSWVVYIGGGVLLAGVLAIGIFYFIQTLKYNKKIVLFRKVNNKIEIALVDKGMFQRIGMAGDYWLLLKKLKKTLPRPKLQIAKNVYWYFEREDGEWINFLIEDIDEVQKKAGAYFVDEDMRLQRLGIQKNLLERYKKQSFWDKYGTTILGIGFVLVVVICLIVLFNKLKDLIEAIPPLVNAIAQLAEAAKSHSSGIVPVNQTI